MRNRGALNATFQTAVDLFNPTYIHGTWKKNFNGAPSTNYLIYKSNLETMTKTDAALSTPSGRAAANSGYGGTPIVDDTKDGVINVKFTPKN